VHSSVEQQFGLPFQFTFQPATQHAEAIGQLPAHQRPGVVEPRQIVPGYHFVFPQVNPVHDAWSSRHSSGVGDIGWVLFGPGRLRDLDITADRHHPIGRAALDIDLDDRYWPRFPEGCERSAALFAVTGPRPPDAGIITGSPTTRKPNAFAEARSDAV
jgi:hypothetical protein